jgi:hypothetical protein
MTMNPESLLRQVESALDLLIATGARYEGLIPSILDLRSGEMLVAIPDPIPGQRQHDRSPRGANLLHDVDLLQLLYDLAEKKSRPRFAAAADRYLRRFARHCTDTVSGLFPWGEHAYWDLDRDCLGNSQAFANRTVSRGAYHDHLREVPAWLWQRLYEFNPECVERFAAGLKHHWKSGALAHEYFRHAYLEHPEIPLPHEAISRDFPRHGGFYLLDWAFAHTRFPRDDFKDQMERMNDYWWRHRHRSGLLPIQSRSDVDDPREKHLSLGQTLSYAASTLDAAVLLDEAGVLPALATSLRERSAVYATACVAAPHDVEHESFFGFFDPDSMAGRDKLVAWGSAYGGPSSVASQALFMLRLHRVLHDERFLDWAAAAARFVSATPFPRDATIPARDAGEALLLLLGLYDATQQKSWLDAAHVLAGQLTELYLGSALPRAAAGIDWYEAQLGTGVLLRALGQCALELEAE